MKRFMLIAVAISLLAADWPMFRGNPLQTGVGEKLPAPLVVRWKVQLGTAQRPSIIESTAVIVGETVYIADIDGFAHAFALATGQAIWKQKVGSVRAPLSFHEGKLFAGNDDGHFQCLNAADGKLLWKYEAGGAITSGANFVGDDVLVGADDENLYCVRRSDGVLRWKFPVAGGPVNGSPVIAKGKTYIAGCDSSLHAIDVANGKELSATPLNGQVASSAAVVGDQLYVGTMTNQVVAVDLTKGEVAWTYEAERKKQAFFASVAVNDKFVIAGSRDKRVHAIERGTGKMAWSFPTEGRVDSSPVIAGDRVYAVSFDNNLYVLNLADGKELQKVSLDGLAVASPAVAKGCLVIGTEKGTVYCLGRDTASGEKPQ